MSVLVVVLHPLVEVRLVFKEILLGKFAVYLLDSLNGFALYRSNDGYWGVAYYGWSLKVSKSFISC